LPGIRTILVRAIAVAAILAALPASACASTPGSAYASLSAIPYTSLSASPRGSAPASSHRSIPAAAVPTARLHVSLTPERLGAGTTITFGFKIATTPGQVPSPLTDIALLYPYNLGIGTSGLGLASCPLPRLEAEGPKSCPVNSHMGYGSAVVEVPFGPGIIRETTGITLLSGPVQHGHLALLFYANGISPLSAQIIFPGLILPATAPFGGRLQTTLPLVPSIPEAPDATVVSLHTTLGPLHITYYEHVRGRLVGFHPRGIVLPKRCPRGGFRFSAELGFQDGGRATAHTTVPCPS
jgi:hypothetical protein